MRLNAFGAFSIGNKILIAYSSSPHEELVKRGNKLALEQCLTSLKG
jgi:hypothetical protein